jgi:hypothetical protein
MRCYQHRHRFYCGVDLHARTMFVHVLGADVETVFEHSCVPMLVANGGITCSEWFLAPAHRSGMRQ